MGFGEQLLLGLLSQAPSLVMGLMQQQRAGQVAAGAEADRAAQAARQANADKASAAATAALLTGGVGNPLTKDVAMATANQIPLTTSGGLMPGLSLPGGTFGADFMQQNPQMLAQAIQQQGPGYGAEMLQTLGQNLQQVSAAELAKRQDVRAASAEARAAELHPLEVARQQLASTREALDLAFTAETNPLRKQALQQEIRNNERQYDQTFFSQAVNMIEQQRNAAKDFMVARGVQAGGPMGPDAATAGREMLLLWPMASPSFDAENFGGLLRKAQEGDANAAAEVARARGDTFGQALALTGIYPDPAEKSRLWQDELQRLGGDDRSERQFFANQVKTLQVAHETAGKDAPTTFEQDKLQLEVTLNIWRMLHGKRPVVFSDPQAKRVAEGAIMKLGGGTGGQMAAVTPGLGPSGPVR